MGETIFGVFCVLAIPVSLGFWLGWVLRGRKHTPAADSSRTSSDLGQAWFLIEQLDREPLHSMLTDQQREGIRAHYFPQDPLTPEPSAPTKPTAVPSTPITAPVPHPEPIPKSVPAQAFVATPGQQPAVPFVISDPVPAGGFAVAPLKGEGESDGVGPEWDPAVLMLYLGALLVVAAGIVYSSYNWAELGAWQKLGMLTAVTVAFAGSGLLLLSRERVRQAAETFVAIGALLVPANAVAAYTVLDGANARPEIPFFLGALSTAVVYSAFSLRPGGEFYSYGAVLAGFLAIGSLPSVFNAPDGWGAVSTLLVIAMVPIVKDRLPERWQHLSQPLYWVGAIFLPLALFGGSVAAVDHSHWLLPVTLATATVAFASYARVTTSPIPAGAATVTAIGAIGGLLFAADVESPVAWAVVAIVGSLAWMAIGERGPAWLCTPIVRMVLHLEATAGFGFAALLMIADERAWGSSFTLIAGAVGTALIAILRPTRWCLCVSAVFASGAYVSIAAHLPADDWSTLEILRFLIPLPLVLAAIGFGLDRWSRRTRAASWGEPVWAVAGAIAIGLTGSLATTTTSVGESTQITLAIGSALFALAALCGTWSIPRPLLRIGYGGWAVIALGALVATFDLADADRLSTSLVLSLLVAALSVPAVCQRIPGLRTLMGNSKPLEWFVFGAAAGVSLLGMLAITVGYVVERGKFTDIDMPGIRWTWVSYLSLYALISLVAAGLGLRRRIEDARMARMLPSISLGFGLISGTLLLRMLTTDIMIWTWAGMLVAMGLYVWSMVGDRRQVETGFGREFLALAGRTGLGLGVASIASNLVIAFDPEWDAHDWVQAAIYGAIGIVALALATDSAHGWRVYVGWVALMLGVVFAGRALDVEHATFALLQISVSWIAVGSSFLLQRGNERSALQPSWRASAIGVGIVALGFSWGTLEDFEPGARDVQVLVIGLVSLAGIVAVDAVVRRDVVRGLVASALAMAGLLIQIGINEPSNVQAYTVPLALYLLALSWLFRRQPQPRDVLLGAGAAMLLVPPLLLAQTEANFGWVLVAGAEALVLFLVGIALQLRVAIAAAIAAISLIVLRMLVDSVNALPSWVILLIVGLVLLSGGTTWLIWKESIHDGLGRLRQRWVAMG